MSSTYSALVIHTIPQNEEPIFHSGNMEAYDRVDDLHEKYEMMNQEMQALRGKEVLKKDVYDLCLVPNVQIPTSSSSQTSRNTKGLPAIKTI